MVQKEKVIPKTDPPSPSQHLHRSKRGLSNPSKTVL
jgi:hypothetical protein